jgi:cell division septum initiation protein DivIVA
MEKIKGFNQFLDGRDFDSPVEESLSEEIRLWNDSVISESAFTDIIKNKLSKSFLGSFSKVGAIDKIRKANLDIEKELLTKKFEMRDKIDALELKLDEVRKRNNKAAVLSVENEIDKMKEEYKAFVKNKKAIMDKGMSLLSKSIAGNKRLKEYFKAGSAEDEIDLSQFEYDLAKKKSSDAGEIENLRKSLENAKKEADDIITRFSSSSSSPSSQPKSSKTFKDSELIDISKINSVINSKEGEDILELAKSTYKNVKGKKADLKKTLSDLAIEIENYKKKGLNPQKAIDAKEKEATKLANALDASENLVRVYKNLGGDPNSVEKKLSSQAELTKILGKINQAVMDGMDANSGTTSAVIATFGGSPNLTSGDVKNIINKI